MERNKYACVPLRYSRSVSREKNDLRFEYVFLLKRRFQTVEVNYLVNKFMLRLFNI